MDEQHLNRLFRDAVGDLPPASFDLDEVVTASRRATTLRRGTLLGGGLLGVVVLVGTLMAGGLVGDRPDRRADAQQAVPQPGAPAGEPGALHPLGVPPRDRQPSARADSTAGAPVGCGPADQELAGELATLLAIRGTPASGPAGEVPWEGAIVLCPAGSRAAAVPVPGGTLYIVLVGAVQPGSAPAGSVQTGPEQAGSEHTIAPDGTRSAVVTRDGGQLAVVSVPAVPGQPTPLADDVPALARELASRR